MRRPSGWDLGPVLLFSGVALLYSPVHAKVLGYLLDDAGTVRILDTDTDTIISQRQVPGLSLGAERYLYLAPQDNLLLVSRSDVQTRDGSGPFRIAAYDLRNLMQRRDLGLEARGRPQVVLPPSGPHFFIRWFDPQVNGGQGAVRLTRFAKSTLMPLGDMPEAPQLEQCLSFSSDGSRVYSVRCTSSSPIKVLNTADLREVGMIDVRLYLSPARWGGSADDVQADRILLVENLKSAQAEPSRYTLFTVRIPDGSQSPRVPTGTEGQATLTPAGDKILFNETARASTARTMEGATISGVYLAGRLRVYDVGTGQTLGQVNFPLRGADYLVGARPQGDKAYVTGRGSRPGDMTIAVLSLTSFSITGELTVPEGPLYLFEISP